MHRLKIFLLTALLPLGLSCFEMDYAGTIVDSSGGFTWRIAATHATTELSLEIPADESFSEPRNASEFTIIIQFPEPAAPGSISKANFDFIGLDNSSTQVNPSFTVTLSADRKSVRINVTGLPDMVRYRIRLKGSDGNTASERVFAHLMGDATNDGTWTVDTDYNDILTIASATFDENNIQIVRSDIDCDHMITGSDLNNVVNGSAAGYPRTLTAPVPVFP